MRILRRRLDQRRMFRCASLQSGEARASTTQQTVLIDADTLRLPKIDAATALSVAETIGRLWVDGQTPVRGEGGGVLRDALVRFLATQFLEKQFGCDAIMSELYRQRIAYASVAQRDAPLARANPIDSTYLVRCRIEARCFGVSPNVAWAGMRSWVCCCAALDAGERWTYFERVARSVVARGGDAVKALMDQQLDQVVDTDLMVVACQQRGADWVSARGTSVRSMWR